MVVERHVVVLVKYDRGDEGYKEGNINIYIYNRTC